MWIKCFEDGNCSHGKWQQSVSSCIEETLIELSVSSKQNTLEIVEIHGQAYNANKTTEVEVETISTWALTQDSKTGGHNLLV